MITREADYSIRAILYLAGRNDRRHAVSAACLAEQMDIPYRFLRKIVQELVGAGILVSERGRSGGVRLRRDPSAISLYDVLAVIDSKSLILNRCLMNGGSCSRQKHCVVHGKLRDVQEGMSRTLQRITFESLAHAVQPEG